MLAKEGDGTARVAFTTPGGESIVAVANRLGEVPLPPYIRRRHTEDERRLDLERYQTVYADRAHQVAVAAPTAGLHFTPELLARLAADGVRVADLTLHVGLGTFRPITTETIEQHSIHARVYELPAETQRLLSAPAAAAASPWARRPCARSRISWPATAAPLDRPYRIAETDLFIHPPRAFRGVDVLITNFHQPRSTLLCLVAAFLTPGFDRRHRVDQGNLRRGHRPRVPVLQLRRRHADPLIGQSSPRPALRPTKGRIQGGSARTNSSGLKKVSIRRREKLLAVKSSTRRTY